MIVLEFGKGIHYSPVSAALERETQGLNSPIADLEIRNTQPLNKAAPKRHES